jgi:hypothetical protein
MDEYIRADNDFRQRREEAYRYYEMARGFEGRFHPRHVRSIHNASPSDDRGSQPQRQQHNSQSSGPQQSSFRRPAPRGRGGRSFGGRYGDQPRRLFCLFCGEDKGHTTRTCQVTIQKQKEIAEAEAQQNQPEQVLHTASCYSPYVPEYVGNQQPTASVASANHSQASWAQLPEPPPIAPTLVRSQQLERHQHAQQQRDFWEESEARISIALCLNLSTSTKEYPISGASLSFLPVYFSCMKNNSRRIEFQFHVIILNSYHQMGCFLLTRFRSYKSRSLGSAE